MLTLHVLTVHVLTVHALTVPVLPSSGEARRLAAEELAKQVYQDAKPGLAEIVWNWLAGFITDFLDGLRGLSAPVGLVLLGVLVLVGVAVAAWLVRPRLNRGRDVSADVFADVVPLSSAEHRRLAEAAAALGDYPGAVSAQFRALVKACEERTVIDPQPGRTAQEVTAELVLTFSDLAVPLQEAGALFNAVRYGRAVPSRQDFERLLSLTADVAASRPQFRAPSAALVGPR